MTDLMAIIKYYCNGRKPKGNRYTLSFFISHDFWM